MTEFNQTVNVSGKGIVNISADTIINKVWCSGCKDYLDDNNLPYISIEGTTNGINIAARKVFDLLGYKDLKHVII